LTHDDPPIFRLLNEIAIIEQLARNRLERVLPDGLLAPHFAVLNHLVRLGDGRSPARIAAAFQVTKSTMTNTLQRLAARGLVALAPDPADGRGKLVRLTEACVRAAVPALDDVAAQLDAASLATVLPALAAVRSALDRNRPAARPHG
jgi:DNA-binding MarR family transcriptional regulator